MTDAVDAHKYRLAQARKMIRLGLITRDGDGRLVPTAGMAEMDQPIVPDALDYEPTVAE